MIQARQHMIKTDGGLKRGSGKGKSNSFESRAIAFKRLTPVVPGDAPGIDLSSAIDFDLPGLRVIAPGAAALQAALAPGRFDIAVDVNALVEIDTTIRPPVEGMDDVMRIFGAEARQDDAPLIRMQAAGGVLQMED